MEQGASFVEFTLPTREEKALHVRAWLPQNPSAALMIAHGMAEHSRRYADFANVLTAQGIAVYACDHVGHGNSSPTEERGFFYADDGWNKVVKDLHLLRRAVEERHPGLPIVFFGHSMGSILVRTYMGRYGAGLAGVVLSGTSGPNPLLQVGKLLAKIEMRRLPTYKPSRLLDKMAFGAFNKPFTPARTKFDWLSRDEAQVDAYVADSACGFAFSATGYRDLFDGAAGMQVKGWASAIPADLPVLLISGERDPVGAMGKGVRWVEQSLRDAGLRKVTCKLYPEARHELLNEINRAQVTADLLDWIKRVLAA